MAKIVYNIYCMHCKFTDSFKTMWEMLRTWCNTQTSICIVSSFSLNEGILLAYQSLCNYKWSCKVFERPLVSDWIKVV
jgi:hypothetical protein